MTAQGVLHEMQRTVPSQEAPHSPLRDRVVAAILDDDGPDLALQAQLRAPALIEARAAAERQLRQADWPNLGRYQARNAALIAAGTRPDLVLMGASMLELWTVADPLLFPAPRCVCSAIAGQTSAQVLLRFQPDVVALRPRAVHLLVGANDITGNTGPTTPYRYQCNVRAMVALAQANGIDVILGLLPPPPLAPVRGRFDTGLWSVELNDALRYIAQQYGLAVADYHAALDDGTGHLRADCSNDGLHPNRRGYAAMAAVLAPLK